MYTTGRCPATVSPYLQLSNLDNFAELPGRLQRVLGGAGRPPERPPLTINPRPPAMERNVPPTTRNRQTEHASGAANSTSLLAHALPNALRFKLMILHNHRQVDLVKSLVGDI